MGINQNHLFEDLNGIKCSIVEKNVSRERMEFLKRILEYNRFTVVVVPSPPPKAAPAAAVAEASAAPAPSAPTTPAAAIAIPSPATAATPLSETPALVVPAAPPAPETFTVGVTDVLFNPTNAIFGRLLKAPGGHIVTLSYWQQKESQSNDEIPYFDAKY